ncbi:hemerythrin domain-containing protein [Nitrogeniibacter mangrovi]|uniref:Hemerythrin domain-containing protein n=1 Tax=Nitrogeniibacter mangrovi TaxID=2016596 RepID=A0A6C1B0V9_9RHOO|nr:hemerythrin domain-containing protein [Nitrogeniibacter mangrovi]QID17207.1 hemerythrin domain-containing protein [Nitrogeniibacter mangrovi]
MTTLSRIMHRDHTRCDMLFSEAEACAQAGQWRSCAALTAQFAETVLNHFSIEENAIFPGFEASTGMTSGPTAVMRSEHEQMRRLLEALGNAARNEDADGFGDSAETLLILMQQHNLKEENILYPMCEQALADDAGVREHLVILQKEMGDEQ